VNIVNGSYSFPYRQHVKTLDGTTPHGYHGADADY
jgi:hypothetical protein